MFVFPYSDGVTEGFHRIGDPTIADAILDRIVHAAYRIELDGESMRKPITTQPLLETPRREMTKSDL